jgi:hypothetical protein
MEIRNKREGERVRKPWPGAVHGLNYPQLCCGILAISRIHIAENGNQR